MNCTRFGMPPEQRSSPLLSQSPGSYTSSPPPTRTAISSASSMISPEMPNDQRRFFEDLGRGLVNFTSERAIWSKASHSGIRAPAGTIRSVVVRSRRKPQSFVTIRLESIPLIFIKYDLARSSLYSASLSNVSDQLPSG